jgi:phenylacetic acid degradation operon negative regulatory protein
VTTFSDQNASGGWPTQPRALIVTIYGLYARDAGGWLSVASLIRMMAALGADEPAVRSSVSRLKQRGVVEPRRAAGAAGYALSRRGSQILAEGDWRIFGRPRAQAADGWLLAVFSVPERERRRRHALRSRLTWLGFGTVSAGVWIAPGHLAGETIDVLRRHGLDGYVNLFRAEYLAFGEVRGLLRDWWDIDRLAAEYQAFRRQAATVLDRWPPEPAGPPPGQAAGPASQRPAAAAGRRQAGEAAFADYVRVLTLWRRLPFLDPGLPAGLLPADWPGLAAADAFTALRERLAGPARAYVLGVTGPPD